MGSLEQSEMNLCVCVVFFDVQNLAMSVVFGLGYLGIIFEEFLAFNKSGVGLLMAVTLWVIRSIGVLPQPLNVASIYS